MYAIDWMSDLCSFCHGGFSWLCEFIECQLDVLYLGWVMALLYPLLLTVFILPLVILLMLYLSSMILYIYTHRWRQMREVLHESLQDPWVSGRYIISLLWDAHGHIWHGYDVQGMEHVPPANQGGLIVYYHGAIPIDAYYLVARFITSTGRHIHCVGDRFLQKIPGWQTILEAFHIAPCSVSDCVRTVNAGHLLAVSPGGVREAQFSDHSYTLLWGGRRGFAKVAIQANCPIIPMFTRNLREAFRVVSFPGILWRGLHSRFKLPFAPVYGGFPVKLVSHLGPCIYPAPGESAEQLAGRVERAVYSLIAEHQRLPGNILAALLDRLHPSLGRMVLGTPVAALPQHDQVSEETVHLQQEGNNPVEPGPSQQQEEASEQVPVRLQEQNESNTELNDQTSELQRRPHTPSDEETEVNEEQPHTEAYTVEESVHPTSESVLVAGCGDDTSDNLYKQIPATFHDEAITCDNSKEIKNENSELVAQKQKKASCESQHLESIAYSKPKSQLDLCSDYLPHGTLHGTKTAATLLPEKITSCDNIDVQQESKKPRFEEIIVGVPSDKSVLCNQSREQHSAVDGKEKSNDGPHLSQAQTDDSLCSPELQALNSSNLEPATDKQQSQKDESIIFTDVTTSQPSDEQEVINISGIAVSGSDYNIDTTLVTSSGVTGSLMRSMEAPDAASSSVAVTSTTSLPLTTAATSTTAADTTMPSSVSAGIAVRSTAILKAGEASSSSIPASGGLQNDTSSQAPSTTALQSALSEAMAPLRGVSPSESASSSCEEAASEGETGSSEASVPGFEKLCKKEVAVISSCDSLVAQRGSEDSDGGSSSGSFELLGANKVGHN